MRTLIHWDRIEHLINTIYDARWNIPATVYDLPGKDNA